MNSKQAAPAVNFEQHTELADSTPRQQSVFRENYQYYLNIGYTRTEAWCAAVDYYRKFTRREVTEHFDALTGDMEDETTTSYDLVLFNQTVAQMAAKANFKQAQYLFFVIRMQSLEHHLNEANLKLSVHYCGDKYPSEIKEIAQYIDFVVRPNGTCNSMTRYRKQLQELASAFRLAGAV